MDSQHQVSHVGIVAKDYDPVHLWTDMSHNFGRVHQTLCVTPAMEAGVSDHVWSIDEIVALIG